MRSFELEILFPNLRNIPYDVTSPPDSRYNCIAWAAGFNNRWWWPAPGYYWPAEAKVASLEAFVAVFQLAGYEICQDSEPEPNFERVAIYANDFGPTHMARQLPSGEWTSKCGKREDIAHALGGLEGNEYGGVVLIMKRPRDNR